eukprot:CAMPEP_0174828842 /NCGR_PEP_ID=MMETSP1114-20130205/1563_1 /TAXON_ID=312471 /ORGANISM="Neobodo designis, Strain CCAP 1951/1" /LENGTH=512 /DNA_ID=CAMNT_0016062569 /DNA_START=285 /DNA_END=1823 /DNA_ORIENTATION=-
MSRSPSNASERKPAASADPEDNYDPLGSAAVPVSHLLSTLGIEGGDRHTDSPGPAPVGGPSGQVQNPDTFLPPTGTPNALQFQTPNSMLPEDRQHSRTEGDDGERTNLYVSNISTDVDDDGLRAIFAPYGTIVNSRIMVDIHTCKSRGFGFVQFATAAEAAAAVKAVDGSVHNSQTLMVRVASKKTRQPGTLLPKVFLRNVPAGVSEDELRRLCSRFGSITTCAVRPDVQHGVVTDVRTGGVSQVAYITFAELDSAKQAALSLNNSKPWEACTNPVLAKVLDSNQKRREKEDGQTSAGPSPGLVSSNGGSLQATPMFNPYGPAAPPSVPMMPPNNGQQLQHPVQVSPQLAARPPQQQQQPQAMQGTPMTHVSPSPFVSPGVVPSPYGMQPQPQVGGYNVSPNLYPGAQPQPQPAMGGAYPQMMPGVAHPGMVPGMHGFAPGMVPPGYQVVMQPTLQPVYQQPGAAMVPGAMPGQYTPNAFAQPQQGTSPSPWQQQAPPAVGGSPGLSPQQGR